ncbi:hypothetical protein SCLCIDRAFT_33148 [Scleroderma citrinum Foug A]|uniref:Uncharacterized protein n=1 Tax=Scleroderma citrinum Foug A TaxID=1036808 RepID=A0A0C3D5X5_9AGAM|nr:hypothetical protein SCLCIDRAFT_33148 [Scleroderma citrinum Foug A]
MDPPCLTVLGHQIYTQFPVGETPPSLDESEMKTSLKRKWSEEANDNLPQRRHLLPPFEIDMAAEKSFTLKFEGTIRGLWHELKDSLVKQADAIEGMQGEVKDLTEAIQGLRADVKDLLGKQMEVLLTMLKVMKDSNTKAGSRSILIL